MKYPEDATQAAHYLREAIPLMVKYNIQPNPRNFALWYGYVSKSKPDLIKELDNAIQKHDTCPPNISADLFRRYIIDEEVDFSNDIREQIADIVSSLSEKTGKTINDEHNYEDLLNQNLSLLQQDTGKSNIENVVHSLIEHTRQATVIAEDFRGEISKAHSEIESLRRDLKELSHEASLDPLTQIHNRRAFDKELQRLMSEAHTQQSPLSLIITDIDHFKKCNDTYGHVTGDKVLQSFAKVLSGLFHENGFPARYGGEEFVILLPNHNIESAMKLAEQLRKTVETMKIKKRGSDEQIDQITTSLGVAQWQPLETASSIISRADSALYQAKENGRNKALSAA